MTISWNSNDLCACSVRKTVHVQFVGMKRNGTLKMATELGCTVPWLSEYTTGGLVPLPICPREKAMYAIDLYSKYKLAGG